MRSEIFNFIGMYVGLIWLCGTVDAQQEAYLDCGFDRNVVEDESTYSRVLEENSVDRFTYRSELIIPVVFHIVMTENPDQISDEAILRQLNLLNEDFQGSNPDHYKVPEFFKRRTGRSSIRFCLAREDDFGKPALAIQRVKTHIPSIGIKKELYYSDLGGSDAWSTSRYLNIWIADTGTGIAGLGSAPGQRNSFEDGVVVHTDLFDVPGPSRTLTHEVGHYLGLFHMWNADGSCEDQDFVADTPVQAYPYYDCPGGERVTCGSPDMYMNFMDYTDPMCMYFFTSGQIQRMERILMEFRPGLLTTPSNCTPRDVLSDFMVFPNPVENGRLKIRFDDEDALLLKIYIYDITGKLIYQQQTWAIGELVVQTRILQPGVYVLSVNGTATRFAVF